jgi:phosphate transport system permease protein
VRRVKDRFFTFLCLGATLAAVVLLVMLLWSIWEQGGKRLSAEFLTKHPSRRPSGSGILSPLMGSVWVIAITALFAIPIGVAAAIYLEEYSRKKNKFLEFVQVNIANLAGVPSIVYGLLGLAIFVRTMDLGRSILAGGLTMALLILPMVIIVSQEALRAVPSSYREGSLALGSTEWQTIRRQVLPNAAPGIFTGIILALSRAIGETAPLIIIGAVAFIREVPQSWNDSFTVLPMQIFNWTAEANQGFHEAAGAAIIVLLIVLLTMNGIAIFLRSRSGRMA